MTSAAAGDVSPLRSPYDAAVGRALGDFAETSPPHPHPAEERAVLGGIVPHHDIAMGMILRFYNELRAGAAPVKRVFLLAPDHFRRARRWVAVCPGDWALSNGLLPADREAVAALAGAKVVETEPALFAEEHGITLHIPLIARFFPQASVVPIVLRPDIPDLALLSLRKRLLALLREGDLVILSMDLSHYKPPEGLTAEDDRTIPLLVELRTNEIGRADVDARRAAALVLSLFKSLGAESGELLERTDSSSILGERVESGTSYATLVYRRSSD